MPDSPQKFSRAAEELIASLRRIPDDTPPGQRLRATTALTPLIENLLNKHQIGIEAPEHTIRAHWPEVVGPANAQYSHPTQIDPRGRLLVQTSHAIVRNELFHHRKSIVEKIRRLPGCAQVRELHLRAG